MKFVIVQPMNGIEESEILNQREEIRKYLESKGHEIIDIDFMEEVPEDVKISGIYYLARAFMKGLCYADAIVLAPGWEISSECIVEREVAYRYGITIYEYIDNHLMLCPRRYMIKNSYFLFPDI